MKIIHSESGLAYHLNPGTQLEIERTNLFFNNYGEQTLPVDLPDTDRNRQLTGYPDRLAVSSKPKADIACAIEDGAYFMPCRQAVLGARRKDKVTTSFYMNAGEFLSRIKDVQLSDIYADDIVPGVHTVEQGLAFCQSLLSNQDPDFAIFPFLVEQGDQRRLLNRMEYMDASGQIVTTGGTIGFYNAFQRDQQDSEDADQVILPPGYYITPFVRVSSVLHRIFTHFGYTLQPSFLTTLSPFSTMVLVNNTVDSLLNGDILLQHLLPDCMVSTLLDVFRKKFCIEFIPNETDKTVSVVHFTDMLHSTPSADLTPFLVGWPEVSFQEERQLRLSSENVVSEATAFDGVYLLAARHPEAWYNADDGCYYHMGYSTFAVREMLSDGTLPYYAGGTRPTYDVTVPDCQYCFSSFSYSGLYSDIHTRTRSSMLGSSFGLYPYVGAGRALNSTIVPVAPSSDNEDVDTVNNEASLLPILSFVWYDGNVSCGTNHTDGGWEYSLLYNGPYGIFERFWRDFDNCLRNAFHKVRATLLLPSGLKASLPVHQRVVLQGEPLFLDVLRYAIGQRPEPLETEFLTTTLRLDAAGHYSTAPDEAGRMLPDTDYYWKVEVTETEISQQDYEDVGYDFDYDQWVEDGSPRINHGLPAIYPPPPTAEQYASGHTFYPRVTYRVTGSRSGVKFYRLDVALRPVLFQAGGSSLIWPPRQHELI